MTRPEEVEPNPTREGEERWEWRSLCVLFCDLVGSTELLVRLDEEAYSALLRRFYEICTTAVRIRGGTVAQYQGDAVVCQFGWPRAAEDDAARSVRAALSILTDVGDVDLPGGGCLAARAGIASGRVKIRAGGGDFGAGTVGPALNRAARLQTLAPLGGAVVCPATRKLAGELFEYRELAARQLKGFESEETMHHVLREQARPTSRFDALHGRRTGPLIGRDAELSRLLERLVQARRGSGSSVAITSPAGYGKSRLVSALGEAGTGERTRIIMLQCAPEASGTALQPLREVVAWFAGALRRHDPAERHARLVRLFETVWGLRDEALRDVLDLISPLGSGAAPDEEQTFVQRRRRAFQALRQVLFRSAEEAGSLVFIIEDLHWADPSTLDFVAELSKEVLERPVLVVITTRPEAADLPVTERLELEPLPPEQCAALARNTAQSHDLPPEVLEAVLVRAEGVPLYVEEFVEMMAGAVERASPGAPVRVPLSLDAIVRSRLDALAADTQLLALAGAAHGRQFATAEASMVAGLTPDDAATATAELLASRLVEVVGQEEHESVRFSHGLIRDAIYASMDEARRRRVHGRIAGVMIAADEEHHVGDEILGEHLLRADRAVEAIERFLAAAMAATRTGAAAEALVHLERALVALDMVPDDAPRDALELRIRAIQGPTLMVMRGPGAPAFGEVQRRAGALFRRLDLRVEAVPVIYNTALHAWARGDLAEADRLADELDGIERTDPSDGGHMSANTMHGLVAWHDGRNRDAARHLRRVIKRYDAARHRDLYMVFLKEFGVFAQFYLGLAETVLGNADAGRQAAERAFQLGQDVRRPHAAGFGMLARFNTAMLRGDVTMASEAAAGALDFSRRQGFPEFSAMAHFCLGWVACREGRQTEGLGMMREGAAAWDATGFASWQPLFAALTAREAVAAGRLDIAAILLDRFSDTPEAQAAAPLALAGALMADAQGRGAEAARLARLACVTASAQDAGLWIRVVEDTFPGACATLVASEGQNG